MGPAWLRCASVPDLHPLSVTNSLNLLTPSAMTPAALRIRDPGCPGGCHRDNGIPDWLWPGLVLISPGGQLRLKTRQSWKSEAWPRTCRNRKRPLPARSWNWTGRGNQGLRRGISATSAAAKGRGALAKVTPQEEARVPAPRPLRPPPSSRSLGLFLRAGAPAPLPGFPRGGISRPTPRPPRPCPSAALGLGAGPRQARGESRRTRGSATAGLPPSLPLPSGARSGGRPPFLPSPGPAHPPTRTLRLAAGAPGLGPQ